jgi:hypothetical protein
MSAAIDLGRPRQEPAASRPDAPIFDPAAFRLDDKTAASRRPRPIARPERLRGARALYDREARFPVENYSDLHAAGLLGICIPERLGGSGRITAPTRSRRPRSAAIAARPRSPGTCMSARPCGRARSSTTSICPRTSVGRTRRAAICTIGASSGRARSTPSPSRKAARRRPAAPPLRPVRSRPRAAGSSPARRSSRPCPGTRNTTASCARRWRATTRRPAATRSTSRFRQGAGRVGHRRVGPARHARHGLAHAHLPGRVRAR